MIFRPFVGKISPDTARPRRFLKKEHVDLVIGLGGYVAFPTARAAVSLRRKLVLLEQNAIPGRVTRLLSRHADLVGTAFEETRHSLASRTPVLRTGTPVRQALFEARADESPRAERILLILGGSGGARALNETVPKALYRIRDRLTGWRLVHQTGPSDRPSTESLYAKLGLSARVESFLEMGPILRQTDLIVCRAGGSTLAELASFGVPAVLLPYPFAADNHQRRNAEYFARSAGAVLVDQRDSGDRLEFDLAREIENLVADPLRRERLSYLMRNQGRPEAARHVAQRAVELLERPDLVPRHDRTEPPWRRAS